MNDHHFDEKKLSFLADKCSLLLSPDGLSYEVKSSASPDCMVDVRLTQQAPGFVVGENGTSYYGTDPKEPWGSMRHAFWPRCKASGTFKTKNGELDMQGRGMFVMALQGMKPHFAGESFATSFMLCPRAKVA